ncbi:DUF4333 domain-containing protein [Mycolicibacterium sp. HK-90]|uniref:DUF4333 domain-containing protein n=1 Tax=Mycolicibacterium sp. HK-90 TaxID=3056937 RepID=UPI00265A88BE|nr:DUF4333 domain-containing protein [Mycolicibacterium sp. HK-90]WKG01868.1 DUF4333 domain-containing protein [Mycolicibacterium sp. HK-90]
MSGPEQPWWARPGGAPLPGTPPPQPQPAQPARTSPPQHQARPVPRPQQPQPAPPAPRRPKPPDRRLIGAALAAVAVVAVGIGLWAWNRTDVAGTQLDVRQAEAGVAEILSDPIHGYGANRVMAVACNNGDNPVVRVGATFTCAVEINGTLRRVVVEITDDNGTYAVDGPR